MNDFRENSIQGPQHVDKATYRLKVFGLVDKPLNLTYDEAIEGRRAYKKAVTLYCVEGWAVKLLWEGFLVRDLLEQAGGRLRSLSPPPGGVCPVGRRIIRQGPRPGPSPTGEVFAMEMQHVPGEHKADIKLYALSTCGWCRKTKTLFDRLGVEYEFVDVDLLEGEDRGTAEEEIDRWNPRHAFPTVVINDETCIVGFDEDRIKEALGV